MNVSLQQAVCRRPLTMKVQVQSQATPCDICGGQTCTGKRYSYQHVGFSLSVSFHQCSMLMFVYVLFVPRTTGEDREIKKKKKNLSELDVQVTVHRDKCSGDRASRQMFR